MPATPSARRMPRTNVVFPAPSSPVRPITSGAADAVSSARAMCAPRRRVASASGAFRSSVVDSDMPATERSHRSRSFHVLRPARPRRRPARERVPLHAPRSMDREAARTKHLRSPASTSPMPGVAMPGLPRLQRAGIRPLVPTSVPAPLRTITPPKARVQLLERAPGDHPGLLCASQPEQARRLARDAASESSPRAGAASSPAD